MTGLRFGRLVVTEFAGICVNRAWWKYICDCGNTGETDGARLRNGTTSSCGCKSRELTRSRNTVHGKSKTKTHHIWKGMLTRCTNPKSNNFERYGAAGITVCERWLKFENFLNDMGEAPSGMTIDRIKNAVGYQPGNCRWATNQQQQRNRRDNRIVNIDGRRMCTAEAAELAGIRSGTLRARLAYGWSIKDAINTPARRWGR